MEQNTDIAPELMKLSTPAPLSSRGLYAVSPAVLNPFAGGSRAMQALRDVGADIDVTTIGRTAYDRRCAALDDPDILLTMVERGWARAALAAVFGFPNVVAFNKWLRTNKLDDSVKEAEVSSADFFADVAAESYAGIEELQDNIMGLMRTTDTLSRAASGDRDAIEDVFPDDGDAEAVEVADRHMIIAARLHSVEQAVSIMARGADAVTKIADRRYKVAFQIAATRNPGRFGGVSGSAPQAGSGQVINMNLNFGGDGNEVKMVNAVPENSSLPSGLDFG